MHLLVLTEWLLIRALLLALEESESEYEARGGMNHTALFFVVKYRGRSKAET